LFLPVSASESQKLPTAAAPAAPAPIIGTTYTLVALLERAGFGHKNQVATAPAASTPPEIQNTLESTKSLCCALTVS
jgi:hypothetical protein